MTRPWFPNGWTEPVIGTEDQMRHGVTPRDTEPDEGYKTPGYVDRLVDRADDWREELP